MSEYQQVPHLCFHHPTELSCGYCESCRIGLCNLCIVESGNTNENNNQFVNQPNAEKLIILCKNCYTKQYRFRRVVLGMIVIVVVGGILIALYVFNLLKSSQSAVNSPLKPKALPMPSIEHNQACQDE